MVTATALFSPHSGQCARREEQVRTQATREAPRSNDPPRRSFYSVPHIRNSGEWFHRSRDENLIVRETDARTVCRKRAAAAAPRQKDTPRAPPSAPHSDEYP